MHYFLPEFSFGVGSTLIGEGNHTFGIVCAAVAVIAFVAACIWRVLHVDGGRNPRRD